jgi:hypothetical protein
MDENVLHKYCLVLSKNQKGNREIICHIIIFAKKLYALQSKLLKKVE